MHTYICMLGRQERADMIPWANKMGISKRKGEGEEMYIFKKEYAVDVMKPQRCVLMVLGVWE